MAAETSTGAAVPDREQQLDALLLEVVERPEGEQRTFLEEACGADGDLLEEALGLALDKELVRRVSAGANMPKQRMLRPPSSRDRRRPAQ